jgi:tRNA threonylcarbamoyladenosine biosynthesis protein TsaB
LKLALDCSQSSGSIALSDKERILYSAFFDIRITHSETLMPVLDAAMKLCGYQPQDIEEIYVCLGPGSFTGLRIGLSTAKGIAFAHNLRVLAFSSLELTALPCVISGKNILSLIDAKMKEVYLAGFDERLQPTIPPCVISPGDIVNYKIQDYILTGSGTGAVASVLQSANIEAFIAPVYLHHPKAELLFELEQYTHPKIYQGKDLADLEPLYIRDSTAQIKHKAKS